MSNKTQIKPEQVTVGIAMQVAAFYGLEIEVSETLSDGYSPYESLHEWDIIDEDLIQSLIEEYEENQRVYLETMQEIQESLIDDLPF